MPYPTPPPTTCDSTYRSQPQHPSTYEVSSYFVASQNPLQYSHRASQNPQTTSSSQAQPYHRAPQHTQSYIVPQPPRASAQESFYHSCSAPTSPLVQPTNIIYSAAPEPKPAPEPCLRHSSPRQDNGRLTPPWRVNSRSPGNPNYYSNSPLSLPISAYLKPPGRMSPYALNRPQKRPGFWGRILDKFSLWIRALNRWSRDNPIKAGILTFFPVMTLAGIIKIGKMLGKGMGLIKKTKGGGGMERRLSDERTKGYGYGLDEFTRFNGSKGGPLKGMLKMLQMLV
ncbi:hypothetical protein BJ878DRAFT_504939 [Calycina marina]|uniref:Uncharacterized protein n=1 Tax=Calycina marina TaxID=1763456 RepID=A0A9P7Z3Z8_9HELO|nr:hypothetical protein BJ878DRAFT_504939 [Calycina marina]